MSIVAYCTWNRNRMKMNQSHWTPTVSRHSHHSPSVFVKCSEWLGFGQQQSLTCPRYKISKRTELLTTTSNLPQTFSTISISLFHSFVYDHVNHGFYNIASLRMITTFGYSDGSPSPEAPQNSPVGELRGLGMVIDRPPDIFLTANMDICIYIYMIYMIAYICRCICIYNYWSGLFRM